MNPSICGRMAEVDTELPLRVRGAGHAARREADRLPRSVNTTHTDDALLGDPWLYLSDASSRACMSSCTVNSYYKLDINIMCSDQRNSDLVLLSKQLT